MVAVSPTAEPRPSSWLSLSCAPPCLRACHLGRCCTALIKAMALMPSDIVQGSGLPCGTLLSMAAAPTGVPRDRPLHQPVNLLAIASTSAARQRPSGDQPLTLAALTAMAAPLPPATTAVALPAPPSISYGSNWQAARGLDHGGSLLAPRGISTSADPAGAPRLWVVQKPARSAAPRPRKVNRHPAK